jgi:hypothetical protein
MLAMTLSFLISSISAVHAQDELPRVSPLPPIVTLENPPATDAPTTVFAQNPIVLLILALAVGGGIPATLWLTQYTREFVADAGIEASKLALRIIGLISGIVVSSVFLVIGMYQAAELAPYPDWLKVIGLGLAFGLLAGGWHDSKRYSGTITNVYAGGAGFGDGDVPDEPKQGSIKDYS